MKKRTLVTEIIALLLISTNVLAETETSFTSYDDIVSDLRTSTYDAPTQRQNTNDVEWEDIAIHGNLGVGTSLISITKTDGKVSSGLLKGIHLGFGINLFTKKARAEGTFTSYGTEQMDSDLRAELKEFDLRVVFIPVTTAKNSIRLGFGIAARYLDVIQRDFAPIQYSTPSSIFLLGFERKLSKTVSLGPDLSYRSALVSETVDKSAWDATVRLNATF